MGSDMPTHTPSENIHENGRHGSISEDHSNVHVIPRMSLQELLSKSAPGEQIDSAVEDFLLDLADDFVDSVTSFACKLAAHRRSDCLQVKDIKAHLERCWNLGLPGPEGDGLQELKRRADAHSHKRRKYDLRRAGILNRASAQGDDC